MKIGNENIFAAEIVGAVWKEYAPGPPVDGPARTEPCAAVSAENESTGVLVGFVIVRSKRGENAGVPDTVTELTPPPPPDGHAVIQLD